MSEIDPQRVQRLLVIVNAKEATQCGHEVRRSEKPFRQPIRLLVAQRLTDSLSTIHGTTYRSSMQITEVTQLDQLPIRVGVP